MNAIVSERAFAPKPDRAAARDEFFKTWGLEPIKPEDYRTNILKSCSNWLLSRCNTTWARQSNNSSLMARYGDDLKDIHEAMEAGVLITKAEYAALLETKAMYEGLCK
jgi:hypothetical protein